MRLWKVIVLAATGSSAPAMSRIGRSTGMRDSFSDNHRSWKPLMTEEAEHRPRTDGCPTGKYLSTPAAICWTAARGQLRKSFRDHPARQLFWVWIGHHRPESVGVGP